MPEKKYYSMNKDKIRGEMIVEIFLLSCHLIALATEPIRLDLMVNVTLVLKRTMKDAPSLTDWTASAS